ncbi:MAG: hypothetical protein Q7R41_01755, partial [Phycisphaerales bacterium]|nr:hypothetical protein [Phycisphaerales bacterium]
MYEIKRARFRELSETVPGIDNRSWEIKLVRVFIRYLTRTAGYAIAAKLLGLMPPPRSRGRAGRRIPYIRHILELNRLRIEYLRCLSANDLRAAVQKKTQWAEFILQNSMSIQSRWTAKAYLSLLSRHDFYGGDYIDRDSYGAWRTAIRRTSDKRFYIYGPNAHSGPSEKYRDYVLVLTKSIDTNLGAYADK